MSSVKDVCCIPTAGEGLIIVAVVHHVLHFRIFNHDAKMVVDTDAKRLIGQAHPIEELRQRLESLWRPHELTEGEKDRADARQRRQRQPGGPQDIMSSSLGTRQTRRSCPMPAPYRLHADLSTIPATSTPSRPPNYIFGSDGFGISATNGGSTLSANDFYVGPGNGSTVPSTLAANLLQIDFLASSNAPGLFGIYAIDPVSFTQWVDGNGTAQLFTNVPDVPGGMVRIGDVLIARIGRPRSPPRWCCSGFGRHPPWPGWQWRRKRKPTDHQEDLATTG